MDKKAINKFDWEDLRYPRMTEQIENLKAQRYINLQSFKSTPDSLKQHFSKCCKTIVGCPWDWLLIMCN